jgi:hypothetical protein
MYKKIIGALSVIALLGWVIYIGTERDILSSMKNLQSSSLLNDEHIICDNPTCNYNVLISKPKLPEIPPEIEKMVKLVDDYERNKDNLSPDQKEVYINQVKELYGEAIKWYYKIKKQSSINEIVAAHIKFVQKGIISANQTEKDRNTLNNNLKYTKLGICTKFSKIGSCEQRKYNQKEIKQAQEDLDSTKKYLQQVRIELNSYLRGLKEIGLNEKNIDKHEKNINKIHQESQRIMWKYGDYIYNKIPANFELSHSFSYCGSQQSYHGNMQQTEYCDILVNYRWQKYARIFRNAPEEAQALEETIEINEVAQEEV